MTIFLLLNGLGVVFLLYVLANFWKEGQRQKTYPKEHAAEFEQQSEADVIVLTHPISHSAQGGVSVLSFRAKGRYGAKRLGAWHPEDRGATGNPVFHKAIGSHAAPARYDALRAMKEGR